MIVLAEYIFIDSLADYILEDEDLLTEYHDDIYNLWYKLGFTQGELEEIDRIKLSNAFDAMAFYIIGMNPQTCDDIFNSIMESRKTYENFTEIVFPAIRRLYVKHNIVLKSKIMMRELNVLYPPFKAGFEKYKKESGLAIDIEAEALIKALDVIAKKYKQLKNRKKKKRRK